MGDEAFQRLSSGDYRGIAAWARIASTSILKPKAEYLKRNLKKLDREILRTIGFDSFEDDFPVLGQLFDYQEKTDAEIEDFLSLLCPSLMKEAVGERLVPKANYGVTFSVD